MKNLQQKLKGFRQLDRKNKIKIIVLGILILAAIIALILYAKNKKDEKNELLGKNYHISLGEAVLIPGELVTVDVVAGQFPGEYPALSFQIDFDPTQLEFIQLKQGNLTIVNKQTQRKVLPEWSCQQEIANRDGVIRTMYLDITAQDASYKFSENSDGNNVLFRMEFKVRDSCSKGDNVNLRFSQATFATVDESNSLSMQKENVKYRDGSYIVE